MTLAILPSVRTAAALRARLSPPNLLALVALIGCPWMSVPAWSAGTTAGTVIDNVASVSFDLGTVNATLDSNTASFVVLERLDVAVTLQSNQIPVSPGEAAAALLFTVTNTGNGSETVELDIDSVLGGDDFDPAPSVPAIYFDSDGSGTFSTGDVAYQQGVNDPLLLADENIDILLLNDIPDTAGDGQLGRSELTARTASGTGPTGTTLAGAGDGGIDAVFGSSGGTDVAVGEYIVADIDISLQKTVTVSDPYGGTEPTVGATLTYRVTVVVLSGGTATASEFVDPVPENTTFVANSIRLNGSAMSDAADADDGEYNANASPAVVVRLGDLTAGDGPQNIEFQVVID